MLNFKNKFKTFETIFNLYEKDIKNIIYFFNYYLSLLAYNFNITLNPIQLEQQNIQGGNYKKYKLIKWFIN